MRCDGFRDAINNTTDTNAVYVGAIAAPHDNVPLFQEVVEDGITTEGDDWEGLGLLMVSDPFVSGGLAVKKSHPGVLLGCFDESPVVHGALDDSLLLFGIDQQPYLQGYLPIPLLTWLSHTKQPLLSRFLETGPKLVEQSPSADRAFCENNVFEVCPQPSNKNQLNVVRPIGLTLAAIIDATALGFIVWVYWNRKRRTVRVSQPVFLVMICAGTIIMGSTIVPLSLDDGVLAEEDGGCVGCDCPSCDLACMASPWLFTVVCTFDFAACSPYLFSRRIFPPPCIPFYHLRASRLCSPRCLVRSGASIA